MSAHHAVVRSRELAKLEQESMMEAKFEAVVEGRPAVSFQVSLTMNAISKSSFRLMPGSF